MLGSARRQASTDEQAFQRTDRSGPTRPGDDNLLPVLVKEARSSAMTGP